LGRRREEGKGKIGRKKRRGHRWTRRLQRGENERG